MRRMFFICPLVDATFTAVVREALSSFSATEQETVTVADAAVIICQPSEFARYSFMQSIGSGVSIVTPLWAFYSSVNRALEPLAFYNANPLLIFSGLNFNIFHLDRCSMTDFYADVILFFGGRISSVYSDATSHTIMETKPIDSLQSTKLPDFTMAQLESTPLNADTISLFVNCCFQSEGKGSLENIQMRDEREYFALQKIPTRVVSYSWLDSCIAERVKLPEYGFYTASKELQQQQQLQQSISKKSKTDATTLQYGERTNKFRPLQGMHLIVSQRMGRAERKCLEEAAEWLGAIIVTISTELSSDVIGDYKTLIVVAADSCSEFEKRPSFFHVSSYFLSKLLRVQGGLPGPLGDMGTGDMGTGLGTGTGAPSNPLRRYLGLLYSPPRNVGVKCISGAFGLPGIAGLRGSIFSVTGFCEDDAEGPCHLDVLAGVRLAGGHTASSMVEGLTTYLLCRRMVGEKYSVAKKWGESKIRVVHWKWLLRCLSLWSLVEPFEDDREDRDVDRGIDVEEKTEEQLQLISGETEVFLVSKGDVEEEHDKRDKREEEDRMQPSQAYFNFYSQASQASQATGTERDWSSQSGKSSQRDRDGERDREREGYREGEGERVPSAVTPPQQRRVRWGDGAEDATVGERAEEEAEFREEIALGVEEIVEEGAENSVQVEVGGADEIVKVCEVEEVRAEAVMGEEDLIIKVEDEEEVIGGQETDVVEVIGMVMEAQVALGVGTVELPIEHEQFVVETVEEEICERVPNTVAVISKVDECEGMGAGGMGEVRSGSETSLTAVVQDSMSLIVEDALPAIGQGSMTVMSQNTLNVIVQAILGLGEVKGAERSIEPVVMRGVEDSVEVTEVEVLEVNEVLEVHETIEMEGLQGPVGTICEIIDPINELVAPISVTPTSQTNKIDLLHIAEELLGKAELPLIVKAEETGEATLESTKDNASQKKASYRFLFGGGTDEQVAQARGVIKALGGSVVWPMDSRYDESCTHLILWEVKRTEKYLCACAAGRWILRPEYLTACAAMGTEGSGSFPPEGGYEWGNEAGSIALSDTQIVWAKAGRRWRIAGNVQDTVQDTVPPEGSRPFSSLVAVIFGNTLPPAETLHRMVISGGGRAVIIPHSQSPLLNGLRGLIEGHGTGEGGTVNAGVEAEQRVVGRKEKRKSKGRVRRSSVTVDDVAATDETHTSIPDISFFLSATVIIASPRSDANQKDQLSFFSLLHSMGVTATQRPPSYLLDCLCEESPSEGMAAE